MLQPHHNTAFNKKRNIKESTQNNKTSLWHNRNVPTTKKSYLYIVKKCLRMYKYYISFHY